MAGFGRREIELMQALCIYNIYIEYYSIIATRIGNTVFFSEPFIVTYISRLGGCRLFVSKIIMF